VHDAAFGRHMARQRNVEPALLEEGHGGFLASISATLVSVFVPRARCDQQLIGRADFVQGAVDG
jgi:hypothetical protein